MIGPAERILMSIFSVLVLCIMWGGVFVEVWLIFEIESLVVKILFMVLSAVSIWFAWKSTPDFVRAARFKDKAA